MRTGFLAILMLVALAFVPAGDSAQCTKAQGCEWWDNTYHEYILTDWDTAEIDIIIVPSASYDSFRDTAAIEKAVDAWDAGINSYGASWLKNGLELRHYTLGFDTIPQEALEDPEVIIVAGEANPFVLFGIGYTLPFKLCADGPLGWASPVHPHDGSPWQLYQNECDNLGQQCVALNTNFALRTNDERWMYDLVSHEFGHCLGIGHVGDALDFDAKTFPNKDIMSYQHHTNVNCVSNLNVRSVEGTFAKTLGRPTSEQLSGGDWYHMSPSSYRQVSCTNPSSAFWGNL